MVSERTDERNTPSEYSKRQDEQSNERSDASKSQPREQATEQPNMKAEPPQTRTRADAPQSSSKTTANVSFSEEIDSELRRLKLLVEEREDLLKRIQADFENSLKRTGREIERAARSAEMNTVKRLLPLLDTIEAGMRSESAGSDAHRTLTMVHDELMRTLGSLGVTKIESEGGAFDADLHEALMMKPGADGVVLEVIQQGYRYGDSVLRHAKVVIGNGQGEPQ